MNEVHHAAETIRRATAADVDAVVAIERIAFSDPPWSRSSFAALVDDPHVQFLVATARDTVPAASAPAVAGYVVTWVVADEADLSNLAVAPARRGQGLGRRLLEAAIDAVAAVGVRTLFLEVRESNAIALALYYSSGFVAISRRAGYYRRPVEDALILQLTLGDRAYPEAPAAR